MSNDLKSIVLSYPGPHAPEDALKILAAFRASYPDVYAEWEDIELHPRDRGEDPLREVAACVLKFLMEHCTVPDNLGAISMFGDMRQIVGRRQMDR